MVAGGIGKIDEDNAKSSTMHLSGNCNLPPPLVRSLASSSSSSPPSPPLPPPFLSPPPPPARPGSAWRPRSPRRAASRSRAARSRPRIILLSSSRPSLPGILSQQPLEDVLMFEHNCACSF
ncbi:hypothetical protein BS78_08G035000 [Paspalum vaginatum]|nr:hypothetical protein BS78_08G035000 [Paspalum vaginatum]